MHIQPHQGLRLQQMNLRGTNVRSITPPHGKPQFVVSLKRNTNPTSSQNSKKEFKPSAKSLKEVHMLAINRTRCSDFFADLLEVRLNVIVAL